MAKTLQITYSSTTSSSIGNLNRYKDDYLASYGRFFALNNPLYKYGGTKDIIHKTQIVNKVTIDKKAKTPDVDISYLVILGGTFEKIGEEDEAIGGGNQKVGSANK